ncbi:undecaprenyl pyrophosphate phosphatase; bacitracin resistance [Cupriavidus taiwanensis]|uniref:undecaprenyl-diphosphate phosphatase n=1 Tax=Cupriavidus taiwanensis TaxID=164546 RepID=UPI000E1B0511|nr:undecaprenyl-diphosphate phosphatase [Cupriavidus taiwanensis]SOZ16633.1 undecaprenyl pyrophosphate phosphatase; bacitracin resistance [Cupriavidus taiwanensis]SOZ21821.1 undecaprenyl pyrophosphate phosphatase; bacitracin resistance [Cupriavidus taiwanensis]SOZ41746.1 undecaprenyl pyrophosphate phosphatase; bacitracin resistance [Cupriavidus taiwanensis]
MIDWIHLGKAFFLGLLEGLTEFLPISSTGHLILVGDWIDFTSHEARVFDVVIQLGAILAVCWLYRAKITDLCQGVVRRDPDALRFATAVLVAFLPAAIIGALLIGPIKHHLFDPAVVAAALIAGGLVILWVERRSAVPRIHAIEDFGWKQAIGIGFAQCVAMIPGTSRSGATIIGGMLSGVSRQAATEFSFFLAIPTMLGAATYDAMRHYHLLSLQDIWSIAAGFTAAFLSALVVVNALVRLVARHSLRVFAWYRIGLGVVIGVVSLGWWF